MRACSRSQWLGLADYVQQHSGRDSRGLEHREGGERVHAVVEGGDLVRDRVRDRVRTG